MSHTNSRVSNSYYPGVDVLRALAILLVLGFHAFPFWVPSGFVGVDVFFVISGFLITGLILHEIQDQKFSIVRFYQRRVIRLFPALLLTLGTLFAIGAFLLSADEYTQLGLHSLGSLGFFQNILLARETGYFETASEYKLLLHLWSLGVEEQFYLLWPLFLLTLQGPFRRSSKIPFYALLILASLSFASFFAGDAKNIFTSFYSPLTRFWELSLGGIVAVLQTGRYPLYKKLIQKMSGSGISLGILIVALLAIFVPALSQESKIFSPVFLLAPVLGATLFVILASEASISLNRFSLSFLVKVGLISFPLYLWHWPILVLARSLIPRFQENSNLIGALALGLSFILAALTYRYLEWPLRVRVKDFSQRAKVVRILLVLGLLVAGVGAGVYSQQGFPQRTVEMSQMATERLKVSQNYDSEQAKACRQHFINEVCSVNILPKSVIDIATCRERFARISFCGISDISKKPTVALIGDSHANSFYPGLKSFFDGQKENLILLGHSSTAPLLNVETVRDEQTNNNGPFQFALQSPTIHTIVLNGFWPAYFYEGRERSSHFDKIFIQRANNLKDLENQRAVFIKSLTETLEAFTTAHKKVILILDIPNMPNFKPCVPRPFRFLSERDDCHVSTGLFKLDQGDVRGAILSLVPKFPALMVVDPASILCDQNLCYMFKEGLFFYTDSQHLSQAGSQYIIQKLTRFD